MNQNDQDTEFTDLIRRVFAGDEGAARTLVDDYQCVVLQAVRRRLSRQLRSRFDSLDFMQDVWASFFAKPPANCHSLKPREFVAVLAQIARNKVVDAVRRGQAAKRNNGRRENSLDELGRKEHELLVALQSTPSQALKGQDHWEQLLDDQPLVYRRILVQLRRGKTSAEVATELDIDTRTVQRFICRLLQELKS
jgi:RNA polymerase sigma factor (sigma-70 family)